MTRKRAGRGASLFLLGEGRRDGEGGKEGREGGEEVDIRGERANTIRNEELGMRNWNRWRKRGKMDLCWWVVNLLVT